MKKSLIAIVGLAMCALACTKHGNEGTNGDSQVVLTPSAKVITLDPSLKTAEALSFTWTPGSNQQSGAGISYTFEMCAKGDDFQHPFIYEIGKTSYRYFSFISSVEDSKGGAISLYAILEKWADDLSIPDAARPIIGKPCTIQARIKARVYHSDIAPVTSDPVEIEIAPAIYMIGEATAGGWALGKAGKLKYEGNGKYSIRADLDNGQIKFPYGTLYFDIDDQSGNFGNCYVAVSDNYSVKGNTTADLDKSYNYDKDYKFYIDKTGQYDILLDVNSMNIRFTLGGPGGNQSLYIVGPATGNSWNWPGTEQTFQLLSDNQYVLSGRLVTGEFKLLRNAGSWTPAFTAADREDREHMVYNDDEDIKFVIDKTGTWTLRVNTLNRTVNYSFDTATQESYTALWMIGDATPGGWSIDSDKATLMSRQADNVFTWSGTLKAGEMKFPVVTGHFKWSFGAQSDGSNDLVYNPDAGTDYKIKVSTEGHYTVTVDLNTKKCTLTAN